MVSNKRKARTFGKKERFALEVSKTGERELRFIFWLAGYPVWSLEGHGKPSPVEFDQCSFLYHMGIYWLRLFHAPNCDAYDAISYSISPDKCITDKLKEYEQDDSVASEKKAEELCIYERIHDIALWDDEFCLPSIYLFPIGNEVYLVESGERTILEIHEVYDALTEFGNYLHEEIRISFPGHHSLNAWEKRLQADTSSLIKLQTGITPEEFPVTYQRLREDMENSSDRDRLRENPLRVAARLSKTLGDAAVAGLLTILSETCAQNPAPPISRELRELSEHTRKKYVTIQRTCDTRYWEEGYDLANFVRDRLHIHETLVNIDDILKKFSITVLKKEFPDEIFALAVWEREDISPLVILNAAHADSQEKEPGVRANLAHEFCHILLDRNILLPVADVLSSSLSLPMEKRARAFAAEFLCPRKLALATACQTPAQKLSLQGLAAQFGVSKTLMGYQLKNAPSFETRFHDHAIMHDVEAVCGSSPF